MEFDSDRAGVLERHATELVAAREFAGIAWHVEQGGRSVSQGAVGHQDVEAGVELADNTLYRLYSMTKPVVSVLCLQLIEAGRLQLDDPIARYLPGFETQKVLGSDGSLQERDRQITVEDLLTHRAGLSYDFLPDCRVADAYRQAGLAADGSRSLQELCLALSGIPLAWQPGARWYYSYATDVLAGLIERLLDKPLSECLHEALFAPLDMTDTAFHVPQTQRIRLSAMYGQRELGEVAVPGDGVASAHNRLTPMDVEGSYPSTSREFARGGIGLYSTVADYRRFMRVLMDGRAESGQRLLSGPMLDLSWQNRLHVSQMPISIGDKAFAGYGWGLTGRVMADTSTALRLSARGEGGWAGAATTWFWVDRQREFSGIVMAQYLGSNITLGPDMQALAYAALG